MNSRVLHALAFPAHDIQRRTLTLNSWALVLESKHLLLHLAEGRFQKSHLPDDARVIKRLQEEIGLAERRCHATRTTASSYISRHQLDSTYARLIRRATTCAERLSTSGPKLEASDYFNTAVKVQMIEDLVQHWRKAAANKAKADIKSR